MDEEVKLSKYSSGVNIIIRLDYLWKDTHTHSRLGQFEKWNNDLDRIWLELARDLLDKEFEDTYDKIIKTKVIKEGYKTRFQEFDKKLGEIGKFEDFAGSTFETPNKNIIEKRNKHYQLLMDKQLFLARLENYLGKGTTFDDEDEGDF